MKKILILLAGLTILASCGSDEENVNPDCESVNYITSPKWTLCTDTIISSVQLINGGGTQPISGIRYYFSFVDEDHVFESGTYSLNFDFNIYCVHKNKNGFSGSLTEVIEKGNIDVSGGSGSAPYSTYNHDNFMIDFQVDSINGTLNLSIDGYIKQYYNGDSDVNKGNWKIELKNYKY